MSSDRQIPFETKLAFGVGQTAEGLKNAALGAFTLFYFSQVLEVPAAWVSIAIMIALVFDAFTDPMAGSISDRTRSRWGRRHPFMYASAVPLGVCFYLLFAPPAWVQETYGTMGLFWWLLVFLILTRAAMTLYHVPHLAIGAELTENFVERTSIVAHRQIFNAVGILLMSAIGYGYFLSEAQGGRTNVAAYPPMAIVFSVIMIVTILASAWFTRHEIPNLPQAREEPRGRSIASVLGDAFFGVFTGFKAAFKNGSFRWLFSGVLVVYLMVGVDQALNTYMNQYFWELSGFGFLLLGITPALGLALGALITRRLHIRFGKRAGLVIGTAGWAVCQVAPVALRLAGWFPENDTALLLPSLISFRVLQGFLVQQSTVSYGSMLADVVDEHELLTGKREEGIFFGASAFSGKASVALGTPIAGYALTWIDWPVGAEITTAADIAPSSLTWLGVVFGPMVCIFAVISVWCFSRYTLDAERHRAILTDLADARRDRQAGRVTVAASPAGVMPARASATPAP